MAARWFVYALAPIALAPLPLFSQAIGNVAGLVTDARQASIPNATVTVVEQATGFSRSSTSSQFGTYSLPRLPVGNYVATAEAPGFEKSTAEFAWMSSRAGNSILRWRLRASRHQSMFPQPQSR